MAIETKKKEFWQMTRLEVAGALDVPPMIQKDILDSHELAVAQAPQG